MRERWRWNTLPLRRNTQLITIRGHTKLRDSIHRLETVVLRRKSKGRDCRLNIFSQRRDELLGTRVKDVVGVDKPTAVKKVVSLRWSSGVLVVGVP